MALVAMAGLAALVAIGYFTIAAVVAPRIKMPTASSAVVLVIRAAVIAFFIGCAMTHVHILLHTVGVGSAQPVEVHELVFHALQAFGAWLLIAGAILKLELHVVPSATRVKLQAAVEEQRQLADHTHKRASEDELTGLARRWRFDEELQRQVAHTRRHGTSAALVLIDVDGLKRINDTFGHQAGDRVLQAVGAVIRRQLRATDIGARIGGDEFAIILPGSTLEEAKAAGERFVCALRGAGAGAAGSAHTSVSAGIASIDGNAPTDVIERADRALYEAKHAGGDRYATADADADLSAAGGIPARTVLRVST